MYSPTLLSVLQTYLKFRLVRPATAKCYYEAIRNLERFSEVTGLPSTTLVDLDTNALLSHRQWCLEHTRASSYNKHRRHLRALFNFAVSEGLLTVSPLLKVGSAPVGQRRPKTVPNTWYSRTIALLENDDLPGLRPGYFWRTGFSLLHFTGMRRRQLVELQWQHILWNQSAVLLSTEGSKSRREWLVPIPEWLMAELKVLHLKAGDLLGSIVPKDEGQVLCLPLHSPAGRYRHRQMRVEHVSRAFDVILNP